MDRRFMILAGSTLIVANPAFSQESSGRDRELQHVTETLAAGAAAIDSSKLALQKSAREEIKRFASFEIAEQEGLRDVLRAITDKQRANSPVATPKVDTQTTVRNLAETSGESFDQAYLAEQMAGHRQLLRIQERYLENGQDPTVRAIASLARGHIREHLAQLEVLEGRRRA
jgi:putative membrane protein